MLTLSSGLRVFIRCAPTDMRLGYEGLFQLVRSVFSMDPLTGHLFVFLNRAQNRTKILFWDTGGLCLFCKRLERGTFTLPDQTCSREGTHELGRVELMMFLEGVVAQTLRRKKRYVPLEK